MDTVDFLKLILLFSSFIYAGVFILLILSGCGFPMPSEITLLTAGFLTTQAIAHFPVMFLFSLLAVFLSDIIPYLLGIFYGPRVFELKYVKAALNPRTIKKISGFLRFPGYKKVFLLRPVLFGTRPFMMMFAGSAGLRLTSFIAYQIVGEFMGVLFWLGAGRIFASNVEGAAVLFYHGRNIFAALAAIAASGFFINRYFIKAPLKTALSIKAAGVVFSIVFLSLVGYEAVYYRCNIEKLASGGGLLLKREIVPPVGVIYE